MHEPSPGGVVLYSLPDYEPPHEPGAPDQPRRWSSLHPSRGPQLALVVPLDEPAAPAPEVLWRLLLHLLEVLDGRRTVSQLRTIVSEVAYEALLTRLRTTPPGRQHRLRRLRTCHPTSEAVELSAVLEISGGPAPSAPLRVRAVAVRLERVDDRWHCAVLRIL
jgi:hypothetical protein